jgi:nitrite reductase (NADH) large subunit
MSTRPRLALVGHGMSADRLLGGLLQRGAAWQVTVFGEEPVAAYDRVALSSVLAGSRSHLNLPLRPRGWYESNGVELRTGTRVTAIEPGSMTLSTEGERWAFDAVVLATGAEAFVPPIAGADLPGVHPFRTLADVRAMMREARRGRPAVVIGGGLLGLEAARGLLARGMTVTVLHIKDRLMERQLDGGGAGLLQAELERMGMSVRLRTGTERIDGESRVEEVCLEGGVRLPADLVVVCAGIRPRIALAAKAGIRCGRGVVVDDQMRTSAPGVFAVGECVEHRGASYGLVAPCNHQADVLAQVLSGDETAAFEPVTAATRLKVAGVDVYAGGRPEPEPGEHEVTLRDDASGVYKKLVLRREVVVGAALIGDLRPMAAIGDALHRGHPVADRLALLGVGMAEDELPGASLPDDAIVCGCNGVTKAAIVGAITAPDGCRTRECVGRCTRASTSCGSCAQVVDGLLSLHGASDADADSDPAVCTCLPLGRERLREQVLARSLRSVSRVLEELGDGVGCHRCRPALSYYLDVWWCGEHVEEPRSRHVNDRVHANIQHDGTFSVVPRIRGGVTSPAELRRIADVAERYRVPTVKLTGGQRIDLLGVRKADLPAIWNDLGMPSGFAYTKAVRTVKSCVGSEWCRFGVGDSTRLAIELEETLENLYTPHKLKLGVSGCPRNCAEVTVKDLGIVAIRGGWEVYVAGAAGMSVRKAELLCTATTEAEALEEAVIAVQHYRENAAYLERMYHFVPRIGIEAFRAATAEAPEAVRAALLERFRRSKANARDPWRAVPGADPARFEADLAATGSAS